ncbi:MAG: LamG-like jellyroll fold domain-containing protein [Steroidobacteraceae bacterium]
MQRYARARRECAFGVLLLSSLAMSSPGAAAAAPYPKSPLITAMSWDFNTIGSLRKAHGSDLWPTAWAADGNLYAAWGDGGGFDGDDNNVGRVSLGFARIAGTPVAGDPASYSGRNVWGAAPAYAQNRASFGGKVGDLISIDGVLYGYGGLWTAANCDCPDPTRKSGDNPTQRSLAWSADLGRTWQLAPWASRSDPGASLHYGEDYKGAWDAEHVYFYYQRDVMNDAPHIFLRRVLKSALTADPATPGHFEYVTALDAQGAPFWSATESNAVPVFFDPNVPPGVYAGTSVVYDAALGRYLLTAQHGNGAGQIGFFEAPAPWGPWATVSYYDDWGGLNETAGEGNGLSFPSKWLSADGKTLWGVFSAVTDGFDSFNVIKAVLSTNGTIPQITAPAPDSVLSPGQRVTAQGTGTGLSWSVQRMNDRSDIATGTGPLLTFTVPEDAGAGTLIRVTLTGKGGVSVYRDYSIAPPVDLPEVGSWQFDEHAGTLAQDSSGHGNVGVLMNGPAWTAGEAGGALDFRGAGQAVEIAGSASLANLYRRGVTVIAWIRPRSAGASGRILDKDGNAVGWFLKMDGTSLQFAADQFSDSAVTRNAARPLTLNAWQQVAATWDGSTRGASVHLYVDGVPSDGAFSNGAGTAGDDSRVPLTIGNRLVDLSRGFDGIIDDVRVFGRVLGAGEIHTLAMGAPPSLKYVSTGKHYAVAAAQVGSPGYTDRSYTLTELSGSLAGNWLIQTSNDDKGVTSATYLQFTLARQSSVYVCYSGLATRPPAWLDAGGWTQSSDRCSLNDGVLASRVVYRKVFPSGLVTLAGNRSPPASGPAAFSNYIVVVGP